MNEEALARARAGDDAAFGELTAPYRAELQLHCYRILGSVADAEDLLQETLLAAWRGLDGFQGRASPRAWLYRIATRRCLNALRGAGRRPQEVHEMPGSSDAETMWVDPYPDTLLDGVPDGAPGPDVRYERRESIELAFIVGLQHLPPLQRAALVLRDVLGYRTAEVARMLDATEASVKAALQRARARLDAHLPDRDRVPLPGSLAERTLASRFGDAVERGDIPAIVAMLAADAELAMPPGPAVHGPVAIGEFLDERGRVRGTPLRVIPTRVNTQPAFASYIPEPGGTLARAHGLLVLTLRDTTIATITNFAAPALFARLGLPPTIPL